jgi:transposase
MEEECQKSKILSHTEKLKREVIRCAEEKRNRKAAAIFGVDESNVQLWQKHKTAISGCEASGRKFTGPKKRRFPEIDDAVFTFFQERRMTGLFVSYDLLREEGLKEATSLNIP